MASIKVSEIRPTGYDLFQDSESFLSDLTERETGFVVGGGDSKHDSKHSGWDSWLSLLDLKLDIKIDLDLDLGKKH